MTITSSFLPNNESSVIVNNIRFYNINLIKEDGNYFIVYNIENTSDLSTKLSYEFKIYDKENNVLDTLQITENLKPHQEERRKTQVKGSDDAFIKFIVQF